MKPRRGEIWRVKLSDPATDRKALGTELGAKEDDLTARPLPERPCLIVSADVYNQNSDGLTVAPLTSYNQGKEDTISLWGVTMWPNFDITPDPKSLSYPSGESLWKKSLIDCAQLWTVFAVEPSQQQTTKLPNDVRWDRRHGEVGDKIIVGVNAALQAVVGGGIRQSGQGLKFQEGDVLVLDLPGKPRQQLCLVISSGAVDFIREKYIFSRKHGRCLGHITVVPLEPACRYDEVGRAATLVEVSESASKSIDIALAMCQEIYTIDWRSRNSTGPVGRVLKMEDVRLAVRDYLDLPQ